MPDAGMDHDVNVIGAAALLLSDRMRDAVQAATGSTGASAAALTTLLAWADGAPVDVLATGLRLSHSRTVRVVDALEGQHYAERRADPTDGRRVLVHLTGSGRDAARQVLTVRAQALSGALERLSARELRALARAGSVLLDEAATSRAEARALCRWCDVDACGFDRGLCPATP